ncbi:hypothetical protein Y032_0073g728 [Ancylostoma ceylanicum]|uniref:Uncharacterized protein n=1 Tax=Ancylostoma ceylanicum TaxID=53326 RepID=A0A016TVI9_9BILA|nr:hypothetical protein Y032_0073g728 [Ancylostoma ceylanicum]
MIGDGLRQMDYLSIHEDDTSIGSDKTDRGYGRWARKRSSIRMFYDESALGDRKTSRLREDSFEVLAKMVIDLY